MLLVPSKGEVVLAGGYRSINGHLGLLSWQKPTEHPSLQPWTLPALSPSSPSLAPTCYVTLHNIPHSVGL